MRHTGRMFGCMVAVLLGGASPVFAESLPIVREPMPWVIESADYTGDVKEQVARLEARYTIRVLRDGWVEVPLAIAGATLTDIDLEKKAAEAHIVPRDGSYVLAASRKGTYKVRLRCATLMAQDSQFEGVQLGIPRATFSTLTLFVPRRDVELRPADQLYVERDPDGSRGGVKLTARLGAAERIDLRWRTKPAAQAHVEPVIYGDVQAFITVEEQLARLAAILQYRSAQGEVKDLRVQFPAGINILNVRGVGIDDWHVTEAADHKVLTVALGTVLKDAAYQVIVEGEQSLAEQATNYSLPELHLVGVKQERGYLAVARTGSIEVTPDATTGINRIDVKELPELLKGSFGSPAILAFKYHQHPYQVTLGLVRHQDHPVLTAIAEQGDLVTVLSRQGDLLTRATYLIKANKKQFLQAVLPEGATLWSCIVDGKSVKPVEPPGQARGSTSSSLDFARDDPSTRRHPERGPLGQGRGPSRGVEGTARTLLIPLETVREAAEGIPVELVYVEHRPALTRLGQLRLQGPTLDVPATITNWSVLAPKEVKFLRMGGNLERGAAAIQFLEDPSIQIASATMSSPQYEPYYASEADQVSREENAPEGAAKRMAMTRSFRPSQPAGPKDDDEFREAVANLAGRFQESGVLPLKVRLPKSGTVYRFSRLMTTQDALHLEATFVRFELPWMPFAALGLVLMPVGGLAVTQFRRS